MSDYPHCDRLPPELLYSIFAHLGAEDLTSCAVTCTHWSAPAIHTKWSTLWVPLGALFKMAASVPHAWHGRLKRKGYVFFKTLDHPGQDWQKVDWDLLKARAALVSRLRIETVLPTQITTLITQHQTPLFPNIRELSVPYLDDFQELMTLSLSPFLRFVELRNLDGSWEKTWRNGTMIKVLSEAVPNLERLVSRGYSARTEFAHVGRFRSLRILQFLGFFGYSEWLTLATECPKLEALTLFGWIGDWVPTAPDTWLTQPCFLALETLDMGVTPDPRFITTVLRVSKFPKLRMAALPIWPIAYKVDQYFRPLISTAPGIEELSLTFGGYMEDLRAALTYFVYLKNLTSLKIEVYPDFHGDQSLLSNMPDLLPDQLPPLRHLTLRSDDRTWKGKLVGFTCDAFPVATLLLKLPALQSLETSLHANSYNAPNPSSAFSGTKHLLLNPVVVSSEIKDHDAFITKLVTLFPNAELSSESTIAFARFEGPHGRDIHQGTDDDLKAFIKSFQKAQGAISLQSGG